VVLSADDIIIEGNLTEYIWNKDQPHNSQQSLEIQSQTRRPPSPHVVLHNLVVTKNDEKNVIVNTNIQKCINAAGVLRVTIDWRSKTLSLNLNTAGSILRLSDLTVQSGIKKTTKPCL